MTGSEWAERERVLSPEESSSPGPFRAAPWQRSLLDDLSDPGLNWLVILKATQVGVSELLRCAVGRWAALDPGDVLWVTTNEQAAKKAMKRLRLMFESTPALRPLLSQQRRKTTLLELVLTNGMRIVIGWAGSAQSLSSDPFRYVILDEAAKYQWSVQGSASPVDLGRDRTKTFGRRGKVILLSSPEHEDDIIVTHHAQELDRRVFAVPCDDCGHVQPVEESGLRWPGGSQESAPSDPAARMRLAAQVERERSAWVECTACRGRVIPHRAMHDPRARWVQERPEPESTRRAYHVPEFWHWETTISDLAAKWLRCLTPSALRGWSLGSLGLPWRTQRGALTAAMFQSRAMFPDGVVPPWATAVLATADTQQDHFWYMVRAWGPGSRSRLVEWGRADSFADLEARVLRARWPVEGAGGGTVGARLLLIDSGGGAETPDGSTTHAVYKFAEDWPGVVMPIKGEDGHAVHVGKPVRESTVTYRPEDGDAYEVKLLLVHTEYWKDITAVLVRDAGRWEESQSAADPTYGKHMAGQHKVRTETSDGKVTWRWAARSKHGRYDLFDAAAYQVAAAHIARVDDEAPLAARIEARKRKKQKRPHDRRPRTRDGRPYHVASR